MKNKQLIAIEKERHQTMKQLANGQNKINRENKINSASNREDCQ